MPAVRARLVVAILVAAGASALVACALDVIGAGSPALRDAGLEASPPPTPPPPPPYASDGGSADAGGATDASDAACPGRAGPAMVTAGDGGFCIDVTEVTNEQYLPFYAAMLEAGVQPAPCDWNTDFRPSTWTTSAPYFAASRASFPAYSVDWCDAWAFCAWAGKRLCGARGGGPVPYGAQADAAASQWTYACSNGGTQAYPYGDVYDAGACLGYWHPDSNGYPADAAGVPSCVGGVPGVYDMSGNAWEWEDGCQTPPTGAGDYCPRRGGSAYSSLSSELRCSSIYLDRRDDRFGNVGFRCCSL